MAKNGNGGNRGNGRKSKYDPDHTPDTVRSLARKGYTVEEMAKILGIAESTFYEWQKNHPEFSESLKEGKVVADSRVEAAAYNMCVGYSYQEKKMIRIPGPMKEEEDPETGEMKKVQTWRTRQEITEKHVPPNPTMIIFWLKNRVPKEWKDVYDHEHSGKEGKPIELTWVDIVRKAKEAKDAGHTD